MLLTPIEKNEVVGDISNVSKKNFNIVTIRDKNDGGSILAKKIKSLSYILLHCSVLYLASNEKDL